MIRYFLARPVAVLTIFFCVAIGGLLAYTKLPVSLMPDIATPRLVIAVDYQGYGAEYIEQNVLVNLRNQLSGLYGLKGIESISANNMGHLDLTFEFDTDMKLAFIEANEKLDQATSVLPDDLDRPQVYRISDTDIPVLKLQIQSKKLSMAELSKLTQYVLRRRIEGIEGVSKVVVSGLNEEVIRLTPRTEVLQSLKISETFLIEALQEANFDQFQLKVRDGIYEYNVRVENPLKSLEQIQKLAISLPSGDQVTVERLALVTYATRELVGTHLYQNAPGIVVNVHKQAAANMQRLAEDLIRNIDQLREEFPNINFEVTQNQSSLLTLSINQLFSSLILGGVLAFAILFVFSANYKLSILMGLIIPATILVTFGIFYLSDLSVNIITLSGLILGIGMLIDNAIILIDNIHLNHQSGLSLRDSCVKGANEIFTPLLSSAFTTLSVFLPLVFLGGIGGSFFQFQAMSLGAMLLGSLLVAFCLLPVLYYLLKPNKSNDSSRIYSWVLNRYQASKKRSLWINGMLVALLLLAMLVAYFIPVDNLPELKTNSSALRITWSEPITLAENIRRTNQLTALTDSTLKASEFDVGINSLDPSEPTFTNSLTGYFDFESVESKDKNLIKLEEFLRSEYGDSKWQFSRARNPFDQLFIENSSFLKFKYRLPGERMLSLSELEVLENEHASSDYGFITQKGLYLDMNEDRLNQVSITAKNLVEQIKFSYQDQLITEIQRTNHKERVQLAASNVAEMHLNAEVYSDDSLKSIYPVDYFFTWKDVVVNQFVTADLAGVYQSLSYSNELSDPDNLIEKMKDVARANNLIVDVEGEHLLSDENFNQLLLSFVLAVLLLYFILAAQFESLIQPVVILITLPIALGGSVVALFAFNYTFNISSLIGMIVTLGIIVNDSILKMDTINRMRSEGMSIREALVEAGELRLKPILMTSITTILALLPLILSSGLGADLQAPLAVTVIGGLLVGTLCSIYMIPTLYKKIVK